MPELKDAKLTHQLTFEGNWPSAVAFLDDDRVAVGNLDGLILVWDLTKPAVESNEWQQQDESMKDRAANIHPVRRLAGHTKGITRLVAANGGKLLISASLDRTIRLWDANAAAKGQYELVLDGAQRRRRSENKSDKREEILAAPGITVESQEAQHLLEGYRDWVYGCAISASGNRLVTGDYSGLTIVWDLAARKEIKRWTGHEMNGVVSTAVTPDGKRCFVAEHRMRRGDYDWPPAQAKIFALDSGELQLDLLAIKFPDAKVRDNSYEYNSVWGEWVRMGFVASAFSPDGSLLAVGQGGEAGGDQKVHLIDAATGKEVRTVSHHEWGVCDVCFTPDGKHLLTAGRDTTVKIIQVDDGAELATLGTPRGGQEKDWMHAVAVSPSGSKIAGADIAGIVHVWQA